MWRSKHDLVMLIRPLLNTRPQNWQERLFEAAGERVGRKDIFYILEPCNQPDYYTFCNFVITVLSGFYKFIFDIILLFKNSIEVVIAY